MPVGVRPDAGQQPRVAVQGGAARLDRRARGIEVLGARRLEEACVQPVHQRQVEPVEPDHRLVGAAVMLMPGHARRQHEVTGGHRARLAVHGGPDAAPLQDEPDGRRGVPVRGRALPRVEVLHGPPQGGGGKREPAQPGVGQRQDPPLAAAAHRDGLSGLGREGQQGIPPPQPRHGPGSGLTRHQVRDLGPERLDVHLVHGGVQLRPPGF